MYANFLYFIIALLILSLYQPVDQPNLPLGYALILFSVIAFLFSVYTHSAFRRLILRIRRVDRSILDLAYSRLVTRHSILAIMLFIIDVWVLDLPTYLHMVPLFKALPTLSDLLFLTVFIVYLGIIWYLGFSAQQAIYETYISRRTYLYSNFAFSIPIIIPYTLLSGIMDILLLLPFELPKQVLNTSIGQTGYFLTFLIIAALFAPVLVQRFWRCRPLEAGPVRRRIEALCDRSGVAYANIVYWPIFGGRMITAGVMGLVGRFRYILVTKALLQLLGPQEIEQVVAHEIGHVKRRHLILYLLFFIGFMLVSYAMSIAGYYFIFLNATVMRLILNWGIDLETAFRIFSSVLLILGVVVYFRFLFGYFMRNFERQADGYVFRLFPNAQPLINTFGKIVTTSGQSADKPNWHHFSIRQRVDYLRQCEITPRTILRHDRKMRKSIAAYLIGLVILSLAVLQLNQFIDRQTSRGHTLEALVIHLDQKALKTKEDAVLYMMIGNLYYERQEVPLAAQAYEKGLQLDPDDADILNNLAWLLATTPGGPTYDPQRALTLAQKAVGLKKAPHIWDTLAQSLYVNGRIEEAIQAERAALAMNPEDRQIYESQLARFKEALMLE